MNSLFIERLDGKLVNVSLVQTITIDPEDDTNVLWLMINGETYIEDLVTTEEAEARLANLKNTLMGDDTAALQEEITRLQTEINEINSDISECLELVEEINGENVEQEVI